MGRRGAMVLVRLEPVALAWILLLPVIAGSVFADAFDWLPVRRRWLQLTLVLGASVLIGILVIPCVPVAIGGSAAVGQIENKHFGLVLIGGATIAVTVVPLIVTAWLAWLIEAPPISRHAALPRRPHRPRLDGAHRRLSRHGHAARGNRGDPGDGGALPADGRRARGHDACRLADKIRMVRGPGEDSDYDTYVDRWFAERLAAALEVSKKMVENAGSI
jgi:hypothetical protein